MANDPNGSGGVGRTGQGAGTCALAQRRAEGMAKNLLVAIVFLFIFIFIRTSGCEERSIRGWL